MSKELLLTTRYPRPYILCTFLICMYLLLILKMSLLSDAKICRSIASLDPGHTCQIPIETRHAKDCRLRSQNINPVLDRYVFAHLFGWFIKALIVPNTFLLWTASIVFEIVEVLLVPYIPSLRECWWDSLILDVFGCNAIGIYLGSLAALKTIRSQQTVNTSFRFMFLLLAMTLTDVNAFLVKHVFFIRPSSPINIYRMLTFIFFAFCSGRLNIVSGLDGFSIPCYTAVVCAELCIILSRWFRIRYHVSI